MSNTYYSIYHGNTLRLVKSLIIKLDFVGVAMNRQLTDYNIEIPKDRSDWIYYKHLYGEYHQVNVQMTITSLDTSETIIFDKETLNVHKKTRGVYLANTSYVDALKERYPAQNVLIDGILRPIDKATAIAAPEGTIFYHDPRYVERQEIGLIIDIEKWIRAYLYSCNMESYCLTDNLFPTVIVAQMAALLTPAILDIRDTYMKTAFAHSFHVKSYFASNNRLDEFFPYLNKEQVLFIYRNIQYLERRTGHQSTFDILVEKLLTLRNLPAYDYRLRQEIIDLASERLLPSPVFVRDHLNLDDGLDGRDHDIWPIETIVYKEVPLAADNEHYLKKYTDEAKDLTAEATVSNLPTKIVEVSAIDPEDLHQIKLADTIISEWIHLTASNRYVNILEVINPLNGDVLKLSAKQCVMMFIYAHAAGHHEFKMKDIPMFYTPSVVRTDFITEKEYRKYLPQHAVDLFEKEIDFFQETYYELPDTVVAADEFMIVLDNILTRKRTRKQYVDQTGRSSVRGYRMRMFNQTYPDVWCDVNCGTFKDYEEFFLYLAFDHELMSPEMWQDLALGCLDKATAISTASAISLRDIQKAMVRLFRRLSSYTIQFIEEIISDDTIVSDRTTAMVGNTDESVTSTVHTLSDPVTAHYTATSTEATTESKPTVVKVLNLAISTDNRHKVNTVVTATIGGVTEVRITAIQSAMTAKTITRSVAR